MKKKQKTKEKLSKVEVLTEIKKYTYNGIEVIVHIDHLRAEASLMEYDQYRKPAFHAKEWVFTNRGLEYMAGWQNILDAMKYAVGEATKLLEKDLAESSKFKLPEKLIEEFKSRLS